MAACYENECTASVPHSLACRTFPWFSYSVNYCYFCRNFSGPGFLRLDMSCRNPSGAFGKNKQTYYPTAEDKFTRASRESNIYSLCCCRSYNYTMAYWNFHYIKGYSGSPDYPVDFNNCRYNSKLNYSAVFLPAALPDGSYQQPYKFY